MKRNRHVFGRLWTACQATGKPVRIELTREGIRVRVKRSRQVHHLALSEVVSLATGQGVFRL